MFSMSEGVTLPVAERVKKALTRKSVSQKDLANFLEIPASSVSRWVRTGQFPIKHREKLCEFLDVTWDYLTGAESYEQMRFKRQLKKAQDQIEREVTEKQGIRDNFPPITAVKNTLQQMADKFKINVQPVIAVDNDDLPSDAVLIPEYHVKFCCGNGISQDAKPQFEIVQDRLPAFYRVSWFATKGINPNECIRIQVEGDSMTPLIQPGDFVLIDTSNDARTKRLNNEIYAFVVEEQLMIKRLIFNENRSITLLGDNPRYPAITMTEQEAETALIIVGRVVERSGAL